jgi:crotonobetainyl-CoA:carnitine CoA-transferase CaiB-like acyl-CoA transferase
MRYRFRRRRIAWNTTRNWLPAVISVRSSIRTWGAGSYRTRPSRCLARLRTTHRQGRALVSTPAKYWRSCWGSLPPKSPFWHYTTSKRGVTLDLTAAEGLELFKRLAAECDVVIETRAPGHLAGLGAGYDDLALDHPGLVMCSLTPFGQTGPWRDYRSSDLTHLAAGGQMASCGYDESDVPGAPPIAPGGGNAWHTGAHFAYIGIMAALVSRCVTGLGQYIDASVHEACALTTESAVNSWIYRGEGLIRQTGRHHSPRDTPPTQFRCKDGNYVNALVALDPASIRRLAEWMDEHDLAGDLLDPGYEDAKFIRENARHIVEDLVAEFVGKLTALEAYHGGQERGFTWGAVKAPDELLSDPHLADRAFWAEVEHPEHGRSFTYPGGAAVFNGTPHQVRSRAPLLGEHNREVFVDELGIDHETLADLLARGVV